MVDLLVELERLEHLGVDLELLPDEIEVGFIFVPVLYTPVHLVLCDDRDQRVLIPAPFC